MLGVFLISGFMDSLYATTFGRVFTTASFEAMALTDRQEAAGFLQTYASFESLLLAGFYVVGSLYLLKKSKVPVERSLGGKIIIGLGVEWHLLKPESVFFVIPALAKARAGMTPVMGLSKCHSGQ